ncbi:hypothetical protein GGR54DRAFT_652971 [Hypoxylon sp. NC1633]|nr:hypothetical protein GGR54DRAFT_652971 [Hypoxylon sp. NC1633]
MEPTQSEQSHGAPTIETNNIHQVLEQFDEDGHIINQDTSFQIRCEICKERNLAILNSKVDKRSVDTHEYYAVLPGCGHIFGYTCVYTWILRAGEPTCPYCRTTVFPHSPAATMLDIFGGAGAEEQHKEILRIRDILNQHKLDELNKQEKPGRPDPDQDDSWEMIMEDTDRWEMGTENPGQDLDLWGLVTERLVTERLVTEIADIIDNLDQELDDE